jgi:cell division protein FtsI/penicillin-binding protein 2
MEEFRRRVYLVATGVALMAGAVLLQLVRWQLVEGAELAAQAERAHSRMRVVEPARGSIYSLDGALLACDSPAYAVGAAPREISGAQELADRLFPLLGVRRQDLVSWLTSGRAWQPLAYDVPLPIGDEIARWNVRGIYLEPMLTRAYPAAEVVEPLLGFVNRAREGYYGVEGYYDGVLRGEPGATLGDVDAAGNTAPFGQIMVEPPKPGADLYLTIDSRVQHVIWEELRRGLEKFKAESGLILVVQPRTGAILGAVAWPSYDPNRYETATPDSYADPIISKEYEPGSVFKVITMAAGLDSGVVTPDSTYEDTGRFSIPGAEIYNWDRRAHGLVTMTDVLALSLNTGAAHVSTTVGAERFYSYALAFGFGQPTGVDLQYEVAGSVKRPGDGRWYPGDLATNAYGQGIAVTPLQMAMAVAAVANDGLLMQPYVVRATVRDGQVQVAHPRAVRQVISPETARTLTRMLVTAVERETTAAKVPGFSVAGKTGTAQIPMPEAGTYHPSDTIASFVGYLPAEDPRILILVRIDRPQAGMWGSQVAAPIFQRVASRLAVLLGLQPSPASLAEAVQP